MPPDAPKPRLHDPNGKFAKGHPCVAPSRKGKPNRTTADLRELVIGALNAAGGQQYLVEQAHANPAAFLALVGRCLPRDVTITGTMTWAAVVDAVAASRAAKAVVLDAQPVRALPPA